MMDKALSAIQEYRMIARGDRLLTALSGGADSVALLHFLCSLREEWGIEVGALHLNHMLRGEESRRDENFARDLCERWSVPLSAESADVKKLSKQAGESAEECGRRLRYAFFEREAERHSAKVAVAHTASDNAETVLINLTRGTALRGLAGIPPVRGRIVRPLILCSREDIEVYCEENGLVWVTDSSNGSDDYTRNRLRRHVTPLLTKENPRFTERLAELSRALRADADYLDGLALEAGKRITRPDKSLDRIGFLALDVALRGRVLASLLRGEGIEVDSRLLGRISAMLAAGPGSLQLSGEVILRCGEEAFFLDAVQGAQAPFYFDVQTADLERESCAVEVFAGKKIILSMLEEKKIKKLQNIEEKDLTYCLDYDRINGIVTLRQRLPGDKLRPPGRGCSKTLKNLFQESGVQAAERQKRVVVADDLGVLWVEGCGPDERAAVSQQTRRMLTIEIVGDAQCFRT